MPNPTTTFSLLVALGAIGGAVAWPKYLVNRLKYEQPRNGTAADAGAPQPGGTLVDQLAPQANGAAGGNTTEARRLKQLVDDVDTLRRENADLRKQLSDALQAKQPAPTMDDVLAKVEDLGNMKFTTKPIAEAKPLEEIGLHVANLVKAEQTPAQLLNRSRAYQAMGFVPDSNYSFTDVVGDIAAEQWQSWYDVAKNTFFYQSDANFRRMDGRYRAASGAFAALLAQHLPEYPKLRYLGENDDADRALRALVLGHVGNMRAIWDTADDFMNLMEDSQPPASYPPASGPHYIVEDHKRVAESGRNFSEYLLQSLDAKGTLTKTFANPPKSTTEILHPERYLAANPFKPRVVEAGDATVGGKAPIYTNIVGELGLQLQLSRFGSPELASTTAAGWHGDRYWIYETNNPVECDVAWRTHWETEHDAMEFYNAAVRVLPRQFSIPLKKEYQKDAGFEVRDPNRVILVRRGADKLTITIITANTPEAGNALDAKFNTNG
jgi:hypothetical protein